MGDLIDRQAAIEAIKTWGLVDGLSEGQAIEILADKEKLPSAQAEIVRCKDCEHWTNDDCPFAWGKVEDAFCSYAERRTDD